MDRHIVSDSSGFEIGRRLSLVETLTGIGYWEVDLQQRTLLWSDVTYRIFGVDPQSYSPSLDGFDRFIHPDDLDSVHRVIHEARDGGALYQLEHRIVRPDGTIRFVLEHGTHEYDEDGRPTFFRGTVQDITSI